MQEKFRSMTLEDQYESIHVDSWDEGKVWLNLSLSRASARVVLSRAETIRLIQMLQMAMDGEPNDKAA